MIGILEDAKDFIYEAIMALDDSVPPGISESIENKLETAIRCIKDYEVDL